MSRGKGGEVRRRGVRGRGLEAAVQAEECGVWSAESE